MALFHVENLNYFYPEEGARALENVSLQIFEGEFLFLAGPSGSGKSTLLRALSGLLPDYYGGSIGGEIRYRQRSLADWQKGELAREIGLIFQNPEQQSVMTRVEQEIAFGLENLGVAPKEMRRRVAEVLALFDLNPVRQEAVFNLSGGQKQKVILAAILAMHPRVLLLDEPTSQLDPVAAQDFLNYVQRLNQEWGITVLLVEQRVDRCFHLADRVVMMDGGRIVSQAGPRETVRGVGRQYPLYIPPVSRVFSGLDIPEVPLTIKEGREILRKIAGNPRTFCPSPVPDSPTAAERGGGVILECRSLEFAYPGNPPCLRKVDVTLKEGSITVLLGENGAGKSTLLKNINGLLSPRKGRVCHKGRDITRMKVEERAALTGYMSQNPDDYLFNDSVFTEIGYGLDLPKGEKEERVGRLLRLLDLEHAREKNPRDLSGGEKQRVALGVVLAPGPEVLLLDEPTRGMDAVLKKKLGALLAALKGEGKAILVVTHDVEFAAEIACRVLIMSAGEIIASGEKREVLSSSLYYSPQANRLFKGVCPWVMTVEDALSLLHREEGEREGEAG